MELSVAPVWTDFHYHIPALGIGYDIRGGGIGLRLANGGVHFDLDHGQSSFAPDRPTLTYTLTDLSLERSLLRARRPWGMPLAIGVSVRTSVVYRHIHPKPGSSAFPVPDLTLLGARIGPSVTCHWERPKFCRFTVEVGTGAGLLRNLEAHRSDHARATSTAVSRMHLSTARPVLWGLSVGVGWTYLMERWTDERFPWSLQEYLDGLAQRDQFQRRYYRSRWELGVTW